jgi:hypothetical protein
MARIVRSYLLHYGYQDTLASFENASEANPSSAQVNSFGGQLEYALSHRKVLRQVTTINFALFKKKNYSKLYWDITRFFMQILISPGFNRNT